MPTECTLQPRGELETFRLCRWSIASTAAMGLLRVRLATCSKSEACKGSGRQKEQVWAYRSAVNSASQLASLTIPALTGNPLCPVLPLLLIRFNFPGLVVSLLGCRSDSSTNGHWWCTMHTTETYFRTAEPCHKPVSILAQFWIGLGCNSVKILSLVSFYNYPLHLQLLWPIPWFHPNLGTKRYAKRIKSCRT